MTALAPVMAMGEAAGVAAALAVRSALPFAQVDVAVLQEALRCQGAILEQPC
jgi:hypothetical protein